MSFTAGDVKLANAALALLAEEEIVSFSEPADLAGKVTAIYPATVRGLLASHPWRFTLAKQALSRLTEAPITEWTYQHQLPAEMLVLRALRPSASVGADTVTDYEIFGQVVMSDVADLWADFQRAVAPEYWPAPFYAVARHALASDLAVVTTGSVSLAQHHAQLAYGLPSERGNGGLIRTARLVDAQQQPPQRFRRFPLLEARMGGLR